MVRGLTPEAAQRLVWRWASRIPTTCDGSQRDLTDAAVTEKDAIIAQRSAYDRADGTCRGEAGRAAPSSERRTGAARQRRGAWGTVGHGERFDLESEG